VAAIQAIFFAVLPALIYLLGKALSNRGMALSLATLLGLRGINAMAAATWIDTAMPKQFLTEYPTAIGLAIATLLLVHWLKSPQKNWKYALWAAGTLGLAGLVRSHVLVIAFLLIIAALFVYKTHWKRSVFTALAMTIAIFATLLPWYSANTPKSMTLADSFLLHVRSIISTRYTPVPPSLEPTPQSHLPTARIASLRPAQEQRSFIEFASANFMHNIVMSALGLPANLANYNLEAVVKETETYWDSYWDGSLSRGGLVFISLNLILIATGIGWAFQRFGWGGLAPLGVFLAYHAVNALARTSGGRYLVPVDWVVLLYYVLGLMGWAGLAQLAFKDKPVLFDGQTDAGAYPLTAKQAALASLPIILILALIGALIPLSGYLFAPRYTALTRKQVLTLLQEQPYAAQIGINNADLRAFLSQKNSRILIGRILYPRYYDMYKGEPVQTYALSAHGYPRTVFSMIGPLGHRYVILSGKMRTFFPNAEDAIVLGCLDNDAIQALVVIFPQKQFSYTRVPATTLTCPFPEPVCNNNRGCR
jgi:hypothetical protein